MKNHFYSLPFLLIVLVSPFLPAQELQGPDTVPTGTLAVFEISPGQEADWSVMSSEETHSCFSVDSGGQRLYFATPQDGLYHVSAALIVDGKPKILTRSFLNHQHEIPPKPQPGPTPPPTPTPDLPLRNWIMQETPKLVKSDHFARESKALADSFQSIVNRIENNNIKTPQNARTQVQVQITSSLARTSADSITLWKDYLTLLSQKMNEDMKENGNNLPAVQKTFRTVSESLQEVSTHEKQ